MPDVRNAVLNLIKDKYDLLKVNETDHLRDDLDLDSLDQVELIMDLEKEFKISLPDEQCAEVNTVGEMITLVLKHVKE